MKKPLPLTLATGGMIWAFRSIVCIGALEKNQEIQYNNSN